MGNSSYGFLPWIRQGLSNNLTNVDPMMSDASVGTRAAVNVVVTFQGSNISKPVGLIGPGDILGISPENVLRTEPMNNVFNFEANYLPSIEFFDEDFLWRYTPAIANSKSQLRPWLALIALKDDEFSLLPGRDGLPPQIKISNSTAYDNIFHPADEHFAYGHVQINKTETLAGTNTQAVREQYYISNAKARIKADPSVAFSRLLCPRRLAPDTRYTCFVIPAFEVGRLAGLGKELNNTSALAPSWTVPANNNTNYSFPVYYQWRFGTSATGDFDALVRQLKRVQMPASSGGREMDITHSGNEGIDNAFTGGGTLPYTTVTMEAALSPSGFTTTNVQDLSTSTASSTNRQKRYTRALRGLLTPENLASGVTDPVIAPPLYGQWQAGMDGFTAPQGSTVPSWYQQLNLDPRYRAAAGLGAQVVRNRQEQLMEQAWLQVGEVLLANEKLQRAKFAVEGSLSIYNKHLIGDANIAQPTASDLARALNRAVRTGAPALKKIKLTPALKTSLGIEPKLTAVTVARAGMATKLTRGSVDPAFSKVLRSRSLQARRATAAGASLGSALVTSISSGSDSAVVARPATQFQSGNVASLAGVSAQFTGTAPTTNVVLMRTGNGNTGNPNPPVTVPPRNIYRFQFDEFINSLKYWDQQETTYRAAAPSFTASQQSDLTQNIQSQLDPDQTVSSRVRAAIRVQVGSSVLVPGNLNRIMAYPVIDESMVDDLVRLSPDYLVPNIASYQNNSITALLSNRGFIEAYMAGLNHEFSRELLWREYPTDQRGSYFRRFWDASDSTDTVTNDIKPLNDWTGSLGANHDRAAGQILVVLVKGELLKKFPNTLIYARKAGISNGTRTLLDDTVAGNLQFPLFRTTIQPDITLVGFDLTRNDAVGATAGSPQGWFFVFQERPGQLRFGINEPVTGGPAPTVPGDLHWGLFGSTPTTFKLQGQNSLTVGSSSDNYMIDWSKINANSAGIASILLKKSSLVAIHADDLIS